jgi:hypothetical protein
MSVPGNNEPAMIDATGVNDSGQVVGELHPTLRIAQGFLDTDGAFAVIQPPNSLFGGANGTTMPDQLWDITGPAYYRGSIPM